jgi:hypothetical protein
MIARAPDDSEPPAFLAFELSERNDAGNASQTGEMIMKLRTSIAAVGAAALIGSGAFVVPALASPQAAAHTLAFTSVTKAMISFSKTSVGVQETDINKAGKTVGFDMIYGVQVSATTSDANVTIDTKGGLLYGTFTINLNTGVISDGKVTGGTGAFKKATGTLTATAINNTKTAVKITYKN